MPDGESAVRLNHTNLAVPDVAALRDFLERHFGFTVLETRGRAAMSVLRDDAGFILTLMKSKSEDGPAAYPGSFHIGFLVDDPEVVRAKHAELTEAGVAAGPAEEVRRGGQRSFTFYCPAPGGVLVEVTAAR
jgi:catechol 2,3-dioxygenase-like lactoylglutathione lyase family enzyme